MVTWNGRALLEVVWAVDAGPEPLKAHGLEQPLVSGQSQCQLFQAFFSSQVREQWTLCLSGIISQPFMVPSLLENLLSSGEIFSFPTLCLSEYLSFCMIDTNVGSRQLRQRSIFLVIF